MKTMTATILKWLNKVGLACMVFTTSAMLSKGQLTLRLADSITLHFPTKPLEKDSFPPTVVFLEDQLMVFPGDFTALFFQKTDTGYAYQSTIKLWTEKKGKIRMRQAFQFFVAGGSLWGIGDHTLYQYPLPNPTQFVRKIPIPVRKGALMTTCPYDDLVLLPVSEGLSRFFLPTEAYTLSKTLETSEKWRKKAVEAPLFQAFDLSFGTGKPKLRFSEAHGMNMLTDTVIFTNYQYAWFRQGNLAYDNERLFHGMHASANIRNFDLEGHLIDSIDARGAMMPIDNIKPAKTLSRAGVFGAADSSGYYGPISLMQDGRHLIRQYWLAKDIHGRRQRYLQVIDVETKEVLETAIPPNAWYLRSMEGRLVEVRDWDFSKGFVKIRFFDIIKGRKQ